MPTVEKDKPKTNRLGLSLADYKGGESTLCAGCGHDAISSQIIKAFYELGINQNRVVKLSGIGCSSKSPAYFLGRSHGFNSVHGRMPSVATGVMMANRTLIGLGVTGDGDTVSIGIGQFVHLMRRNVPIVYVIENNGVYGLTKGQFSATAERGSKSKSGVSNPLPSIDCCQLAIDLGCSYVARSFAGDPKQLVALLKGALSHRGATLLDVISPCVTFNNHPDSTKSYDWAKEHEELLNEVGFVPYFDQITVDYDEGTTKDVALHDGSHLRLKKLHRDYDPMSRSAALRMLEETKDKGELLTGLIYVDPTSTDFITLMNVVDEPLATLPQDRTRPRKDALDQIMEELR